MRAFPQNHFRWAAIASVVSLRECATLWAYVYGYCVLEWRDVVVQNKLFSVGMSASALSGNFTDVYNFIY
jgi:hypothetical protein